MLNFQRSLHNTQITVTNHQNEEGKSEGQKYCINELSPLAKNGNGQLIGNGECSQEERALQVYKNTQIELDLQLQVWNIDDRIIKDTDHRKRPTQTFSVLKNTTCLCDHPMTTFDHMNHIQNLYQSHAQLLQCDDQILFFNGGDKLTAYQVKEKVFFFRRVKSITEKNTNFQTKSFKTMLHQKDIGKRTEYVENIICLAYSQFEKPSEE